MTSDLSIDVRALVKNFDATVAVGGLDVAVGRGRILGLVGPNGAGKTTAMRCMAGIIPATSGTVTITGIDLAQQPLVAKARLSFVPDTPHLFDYLTVEEHLRFAGRIYGVADVDAKIEQLLGEFELLDKRRHLPQALSRGMRQKVAICLGFLHEPSVIMLDEPLTGLDPLGIRRMKEAILRRSREQGAAIIVSSHQLELVEAVCDEIFIIKGGRRVISGTLEEIRAALEGLPEEPTLEDIFFCATTQREEAATAAPRPVGPVSKDPEG